MPPSDTRPLEEQCRRRAASMRLVAPTRDTISPVLFDLAADEIARLREELAQAREALEWAMDWIPAQYEPMCRFCGSSKYISETDDRRLHYPDCGYAAARRALSSRREGGDRAPK